MDGQYFAQYGEDTATKKVLGEISKEQLIAVLANSGLGLTLDSTPEEIYAALATKFPQQLSMLVPGWISSGVLTLSCTSNTSSVKMTVSSTPTEGHGYYTSPAFDITAFQTLQIVGSAYKAGMNDGSGGAYRPSVHLINVVTGAIIELYRHVGTQKVTENINKTVSLAGYSGKYSLRLDIFSYPNDSSKNNGSYINLTKALLIT